MIFLSALDETKLILQSVPYEDFKMVYINKVLHSAVKSIFLLYATCNQFSNFKNGYTTNTSACGRAGARTRTHTAQHTCNIKCHYTGNNFFFFVGVFLHVEGVAKYCHM